MKIDIRNPPPADIFKNRKKYIIIFIVFLSLACLGLLFGAYAIIADTAYYEYLETAALSFFVGSALFIAYFGEKLQAYKKLIPPQQEELAELMEKHAEIRTYCDQLERARRQPIRAEYEACQAFATQKEQEIK
jgi:hypothetical protein